MKWLVRSIPLVALLGLSCTTTTSTTVVNNSNSLLPTISGFSPDTVWTFKSLKVFGTDFGYDPADIRVYIDTTPLEITSIDDTVLTVTIPEITHSGLIRIRSYEQTATSAKPVVVNYSFSPHTTYDSVPIGGSFSIPGTGMNNYHGALRISLNGRSLPVDAVFPNRIVSHVTPNCWSGTLTVSDSMGSYGAGSLTVTRPSFWRTVSLIWDNLVIREYHLRTGYVNGPGHPIDSGWYVTATYSGQVDTSIWGTAFAVSTPPWLVYSLNRANNGAYPLLQISWDTVNERAQIAFEKYSSDPTPSSTNADTLWYDNNENIEAALPVDRDVEFSLPNIRYQILKDSTDGQGLVNWQETTNTSIVSGSFDIILKQ